MNFSPRAIDAAYSTRQAEFFLARENVKYDGDDAPIESVQVHLRSVKPAGAKSGLFLSDSTTKG
jgi:hypothetical protein